MHRILSCGRFCSFCSLHYLAFAEYLRRKLMSFLHFVCWDSAIINCLGTVVITETSEGHMGCNRPLFLLDREIRIHFCHRKAQYSFWKKKKGSLLRCMCFFPFSSRNETFILRRRHEKYNTWYVSVNWREERESHMSTFSLQSSQNVYLSAFKDWNNPKRKFITELKFLGS